MKVLQINTAVNSGSTGRMAEGIGQVLIERGHQSLIAFGRGNRPSNSGLIRIGTRSDLYSHVLISRLFDLHGFGSAGATRKFIEEVKKADPDIFHLHNIHGYYLNIEILFNYLRESGKPVIWTLHDCWSFTGHCSYFDRVNCYKWHTGCHKCPNLKGYPESWFIDNSKKNYLRKKSIFSEIKNLTIITPSSWLAEHVKRSYLKKYPLSIINNGVDLSIFKPEIKSIDKEEFKTGKNKYILGVANSWDKRKGLIDFIEIRKLLPAEILILLVGLNRKQILELPSGIIGIPKIESALELASLYSGANAFLNPTYVDNFPTTNLEALACGTPVITYNTGGSAEIVNKESGYVLNKGDFMGLSNSIKEVLSNGKKFYMNVCRERAEKLFDSKSKYCDYIKLYKDVSGKPNSH